MPRRKARKGNEATKPAEKVAHGPATPPQDAVPVSPTVTTNNDRRAKKEKRRRQNAPSRDLVSLPSKLVFGDAAASNKLLSNTLNDLETQVEHLKIIVDTKSWFPRRMPKIVIRKASQTQAPVTTRPMDSPPTEGVSESESRTITPPALPSYASALESLNSGIRLLGNCSNQLLHVQIPEFKRKPMKRGPGRPRKKPPVASPFFQVEESPPSPLVSSPEPQTNKIKKSRSTPKASPHFITDPFSMQQTPEGLPFTLEEAGYGLIQERIRNSLYAGVAQTILWNQTTGKAARPVLFKLLCTYPTPADLADADVADVTEIIRCLGLQNRRAERLVKLAQVWVDAPPSPDRRYARRHYPHTGDNIDIRDGQLLEPDDIRAGWEIAHLPGVGQYALDSYRIFFRDTLRDVKEGDGMEPEWKRVVPLDKDLRPYLVWRWAQEGWRWDPLTGNRERLAT